MASFRTELPACINNPFLPNPLDVFQLYDYGIFGNFRRYGSSSPPAYNTSAITSKVAIFYSNKDWLAAPEVTF